MQVFVCEDCGYTAPIYDDYVQHLSAAHPLSAVLLKLNATAKVATANRVVVKQAIDI